MARRARRRSSVSIFTTNPRRRRRVSRSRRRSTVFARNPARRRRRARSYRRNPVTAARRVYRRNPSRSRRRTSSRRYRRNPIGVGKLSSLLMPAVFIGLGGLATEIACGYLPIPIAWKTGPMRYLVKGAVGVGIGLILAKGFKQKRIGYYFAAGAVVLMTHDFFKAWLNAQAPAIRGLGMYSRALPSQFGYTNPGSIARFNGMGQYARRLPTQFGGANTIPNARQAGGEMNFAA